MDPKDQRPELWNIFNGRKNPGEHFWVFPISNWTELDVWQYICQQNIQIPSIYFTYQHDCFARDGVIYGYSELTRLKSSNPELFASEP